LKSGKGRSSSLRQKYSETSPAVQEKESSKKADETWWGQRMNQRGTEKGDVEAHRK